MSDLVDLSELFSLSLFFSLSPTHTQTGLGPCDLHLASDAKLKQFDQKHVRACHAVQPNFWYLWQNLCIRIHNLDCVHWLT